MLLPNEAAVVETAAALARSNPFGATHRRTAAALTGRPADDTPVWIVPSAREAIAARLRPLMGRLPARMQRASGILDRSLATALEGLLITWWGVSSDVAAPLDASWLGVISPAVEASARDLVNRRSLLTTIRRDWPGGSSAAAQLRMVIWRAAWADDGFAALRSIARAPTLPLVIHGPAGAPRRRLAATIAAAGGDPQLWSCFLPAPQAADRIRAALRGGFVDRVETADVGIQAALLEQLSGEPSTRWCFGVVDRAGLNALAEELAQRVAGAEVEIPPLAALLSDGGLQGYVRRAMGAFGVDDEARVDRTVTWMRLHVGARYPWPGHLAELDRCVRTHLSGGVFRAAPTPVTEGLPPALTAGLSDGSIDAGALLSRYCTWVYALTGSYVATAERLGIDRRTVRKRVDPALLPIFADRRPL